MNADPNDNTPRPHSGGCYYILMLLTLVALAMVLGGMAGVGP